MTDVLAAIPDNLPLILSLGFIGVMLLAFGRGLRIKPRSDDERAPQRLSGGWLS